MNRLECGCGRVLGYEARHAGKTVKCSGCGQPLKVPAEKDAPIALRPLDDPEPEPMPRPRKRKRSEPEDDPVERVPRMEDDFDDDEDEGDESPRRKRRGPEPGPMNHLANFLVQQAGLPFLILLVGGAMFGISLFQGALSSDASSTPQTIGMEELMVKGPGGNRHVIITGAVPAPENMRNTIVTTWKSRRSGAISTTEQHFVPLLPAAGKAAPARPNHPIIIKSDASRDQLATILSKPDFKGLLVRASDLFSGEKMDRLKQAYPGVDFAQAYLLDEGVEPWSRALVMTLFLGGILLMALTLAMWLIMLLFHTE